MTGLGIGHILLPSLAGCAYLYSCDPRGHVILLVALLIYVALAAQDYLFTCRILSAFLHASLALAAQALLIVFATVSYRLSPFHPLAQFPGPVLDKVTGLRLAYFAFTGRRMPYIAELHEEYGVIVRIGPNKLSINSIDAIHPIYASSQAFDKAESYRPGRAADGSLFFTRGKVQHGRRRRIWASALTNTVVQQWDKTLKLRTDQLVECIARRQNSHGVVDLSLCFEHWGFDFTSDWAFGAGCSGIEFMRDGDVEGVAENAKEAIVIFEAFGEVPALFDIISSLPVAKNYRQMEKLAEKILKKRLKTSPPNEWDLCSFLLAQHEDHQYPPLNEDDLKADTVLAFEAGTITMFYLLHHPEAYEKLRHELDQAFPAGEITSDQYASLADLPYLAAVVNEGLRFGAGFPGFPRIVPKDGVVLEGRFIPEGTIVGVPIYAQHMSPENFWPAPREFKPERWFEDGLGSGTITRRAGFMAFQFGPFGCPGKALAYREINAVLSHVVLSYDLRFAPGFDPEAFLKGWANTRTTMTKYHLRVKAKQRQH
ncbi:uncharacterized protein PHACADRAFT_25314 [Phanerochaete carnosa HHB-10118-sp]|uniref:Cytochrome P450 n=1 Tax=Phanerochaete carnosa (strain HHB-10118-sp) TaxID=650164 RepID=K5X8K5_PHACS|nr:uncharacterized protein PHACADRAFT_25314 [Phanerochaete carnosa HHB-10118-sp]EKM59212.1 hypothetical protein PHACADRAFT_25314 [Phanerochaete carnosa HHB-10118-sp]